MLPNLPREIYFLTTKGAPMLLSELVAAKDAIAKEPGWVFDLAAERGQVFDNVKHMGWFIMLVAEELRGRAKGAS